MKGDSTLVHRIPVKDGNGKVIGEKEVVAYRGLLDLVHKERLSEIRTQLLQAPAESNANTAIVWASVTTNRGSFTGIGDANPRNVNARIAPHLIRMAETRAEARAMRKAVNIGMVAMEELGDDLDDDLTYEGTLLPPGGSNGQSAGPGPCTPAPVLGGHGAPAPSSNANGTGYRGSASDNKPSDSQRRFLFRLLAERGMHGEEARKYIHSELGVTSLDDATKGAVSALIDRLKNGNGQHTQPPEPGSRG